MKSVSRYAHLRCTSDIPASTSETQPSFFCQPTTSSSNCARYFDPIIPWTTIWFSSSVSKSSSFIFIRLTSESRWRSNSNSTTAHVDLSFASVCSILSSFVARSTTSPTSSTNWWSFNARRSRSENVALISIVTPVISMSCFQWRSRIDGDLRSPMHGSASRKSLMSVSQPPKASKSRARFGSPLSALWSAFASESIVSVSMSFHSVPSHSVSVVVTTEIRSHSPLMMRRSARQSATSDAVRLQWSEKSKSSANSACSFAWDSIPLRSTFIASMSGYAASTPHSYVNAEFLRKDSRCASVSFSCSLISDEIRAPSASVIGLIAFRSVGAFFFAATHCSLSFAADASGAPAVVSPNRSSACPISESESSSNSTASALFFSAYRQSIPRRSASKSPSGGADSTPAHTPFTVSSIVLRRSLRLALIRFSNLAPSAVREAISSDWTRSS